MKFTMLLNILSIFSPSLSFLWANDPIFFHTVWTVGLHFISNWYLKVVQKLTAYLVILFITLSYCHIIRIFMLIFLTWPLALPVDFWKKKENFWGLFLSLTILNFLEWDSPETIWQVTITKRFQLDTLIFYRAFQLLQRFSFISNLICIID